ncbi:MAG: hypothetical protein RR547_11435, partial [Raoultibacter sp.]
MAIHGRTKKDFDNSGASKNNEDAVGEKASNAGVVLLSMFVFTVVLLLLVGLGVLIAGSFTMPVAIVSFVLAVLATMSVHIAQQWERVVVLRLGRF